MNKAEVTKLMSTLKYAYGPRCRRNKNPGGPEGRLLNLRRTVTALLKYERLELNFNRGDEARGYAERLISDAIRNGDTHKPTMEMADFWILDKTIVHKLFKVIAPRVEKNPSLPATQMFKAPREYPCTDMTQRHRDRCILELRGNPFPPVAPLDQMQKNRNLIHNVLLDEAKKEFYREKQKKIAEAAESMATLSIENNVESTK